LVRYKKKKGWGLPVLLGFAILLVVPAVLAYFPDGFDQYAGATSNPGPWTIIKGDPSCWPLAQVFTGSVGSLNPLSPPNIYTMQYITSCDGNAETSDLYMTMTAINTIVNFNFSVALSTQPGTESTDAFQLVMCGAPVDLTVNGTATSSTSLLFSVLTTPSDWTSVSGSVFMSTGGSCGVAIRTNSVSGNVGSFVVDFDSTHLNGAVARLSTSHDIALVDSRTLLPFDIASYPSSSISINYTSTIVCDYPFVQTSSTVCTLSDTTGAADFLTIPFFSTNLLRANLITVHLGTSYFRTVIPLTNNVTVYLDPPTAVGTYAITINDLSGIFGTGSSISLSNGIVITSGYFDHASTFTAAMIPGVYSTLITQGNHTLQTTLTFGTVSAISLNIAKFTTSNSLGFLGTASYGFVWNCDNTHLIATFEDPSLTTTMVSFTIWNQTSAATQTVIKHQTFTAGPYGSLSLDVGGINASQGTYLMNMSSIDGFDAHSTGYIYVTGGEASCPNSRPGILGNILAKFDFPASVFGLDQFANVSWDGIFSLFLITLTAGVFGARQSKFGFVVVGFESMFLFFALLLPPVFGGYLFYYSMVAIAVIGFLRYKAGPLANFLPALVVFSIVLNVAVPFANAMGIAGGTMPFDPTLSVDTLLSGGAGCARAVNGTVTCTTDFGNLGLLGGFAAFGNFIWAIIKLLVFVPTVIFLPGIYMVSIFYAPVLFAALYNIGFVAIFVFWLADFIANRQIGATG